MVKKIFSVSSIRKENQNNLGLYIRMVVNSIYKYIEKMLAWTVIICDKERHVTH